MVDEYWISLLCHVRKVYNSSFFVTYVMYVAIDNCNTTFKCNTVALGIQVAYLTVFTAKQLPQPTANQLHKFTGVNIATTITNLIPRSPLLQKSI